MRNQIKEKMEFKHIKLTARIIAAIAVFYSYNSYAQDQVNKFSDPEIQKIHELTDHRDGFGLLPYLKHSNLNYQGEALMCFGCIQEPEFIYSIAPSLESEMNGIRMAAAFALGQTYSAHATECISTALEKDTVKLVRGMLFDALGKTGDSKHLEWLAKQETDYQEAEGQVMGILRFAIRGITSPEGNSRVLQVMQNGTSSVGLIYASYHLGRYADSLWLYENVNELENIYIEERDPVVSSYVIMAIIKARNNNALPQVEVVLKSDEDYREKVNVLKTINEVVWEDARKLVYKYSMKDDPNLAVAAAEAIQKHARPKDFRLHMRSLKKVQNWRVRAILYGKAMEISGDNEKSRERMADKLTELFIQSTNPVEKAWLLKSLKSVPGRFQFVENQLDSQHPVIRTSAMETLSLMVKHQNFKAAKEKMELTGQDLDGEFLEIFKKGIASGDIALVSMAAIVLRDTSLAYKELIEHLTFLEKALADADSPNMIEAKNELITTLSYFTDKEGGPKSSPDYNHPIDWDRVRTIPPRQLVGIVTSKGEIVVQMNVNWCPGTVSAFIELAEKGFYDNKTIHRVVPNFVVQDGCPRGDGWGGPPFTIRSEFTPAPFLEGTFGMASAGKDTEGSQWYFTHTATPHLDGKYSNFGTVVEGIDVVHQLQVGDLIEKVVVIEEENDNQIKM